MIWTNEIVDHKLGNSTRFEEVAKDLGFEIALEDDEVEEGFDGQLYEKGFARVKTDAEIAEEKRAIRDRYLNVTDKYLSISDFPVTDEEREQYKVYRQYLRDLPDSSEFPNCDVLTFEQWTEEVK